jgi:hypothetical protein
VINKMNIGMALIVVLTASALSQSKDSRIVMTTLRQHCGL